MKRVSSAVIRSIALEKSLEDLAAQKKCARPSNAQVTPEILKPTVRKVGKRRLRERERERERERRRARVGQKYTCAEGLTAVCVCVSV